ncbi:hypothetical protein BCR32DRAFT_271497 [Anaeromyces robustus]|uniref:DH domain-containing protein n=1 Tax=Anaeromyces robustus TaxID=1754192 RepID=A0A1Y1WRC7_9FUNG|nr:hypothetical protein BCR32DRAFT_271497 [Anaeromyces robustus]|eukprot:ORX76091.1 hypothetical protein BCR32DRAFT_271497 [Anaeromyces robustus]
MLNINQESLLKELTIIQNQLELATPEKCVYMLQLLASSSKIAIIEQKERTSDVSDEEWNNYCNSRYQLGSFMMKLIRDYSVRLNDYLINSINEINKVKLNQLKINDNTNSLSRNYSLNTYSDSLFRSSTLSSNPKDDNKNGSIHQKSVSQKSKIINKGKSPSTDSIDDSLFSTDKSNNNITLRKGSSLKQSINIDGLETSFDDSHSDKYVPSNIYDNDELNNGNNKEKSNSPLTPKSESNVRQYVNSSNSINKMNSIRSSPSYNNKVNNYNNRLSLSNSFKIGSIDTINSIDSDNSDVSYMNQMQSFYYDENNNDNLSFEQQQQIMLQDKFNTLLQGQHYNNSEMTDNAVEEPDQYQNNEEIEEDNSKDNFIGNYICIKNYQNEGEIYIDLEAGDIVSISEFSGKYAIGFNCRTECNGLFPIYNIDSLNGFAIFYRVIADSDDASKNDAIFVVSEAENDLLLGYNITKEDTGSFRMDQLEVLQFDNDNNPILDEALLNNPEAIQSMQTIIQPIASIQSMQSIPSLQQMQASQMARIQSGDSYVNDPRYLQYDNSNIYDNVYDYINNNIYDSGIYNQNGYIDSNQSNVTFVNSNQSNVTTYNYYDNNNYDQVNNQDSGCYSNNDTSFNNKEESEQDNHQFNNDTIMAYSNIINKINSQNASQQDSLELLRAATYEFEKLTNKNAQDIGISSTNTIKRRNKKLNATDHNAIKYILGNLIEKETDFNKTLKSSIDHLINPFEKLINTSDEILTKFEMNNLFKNFPGMYSFSNTLLKGLKKGLEEYDEKGLNNICEILAKNFINCAVFLDYSAYYESLLDIINHIQKDNARFEKINNIIKMNNREFRRMQFKDLFSIEIQHFLSYNLYLKDIQRNLVEDDLYESLESEIQYLYMIGLHMDKTEHENVQIRKLFALKKFVMGYPDSFISSKRKLISEYDITENGRPIQKRIYLFNDSLMVVTTNKEATRKGYKYLLENIISIKDYEFTKVDQGTKPCIKCVCKSNNNSGQFENLMKNNASNRRSGLFKYSKGRKPQSKINYLYFIDMAKCDKFFSECTLQKNKYYK